jgi:hypothetical protein
MEISFFGRYQNVFKTLFSKISFFGHYHLWEFPFYEGVKMSLKCLFQNFPFLEITIFRINLLIGSHIIFFQNFLKFHGYPRVDLDPFPTAPSPIPTDDPHRVPIKTRIRGQP